jgi:hypothetical protein
MLVSFDCDRTCPLYELVDLCRFTALLRGMGIETVVNSHVTKVDVQFKSLDAIRAAAEALGMDLLQKDTYRWWGRAVGDYPLPEGFSASDLGKCDYALGVRGSADAFEAGLVLKNGAYHMLYDFYGMRGQKLIKAIGQDASKFKAEYALAAARQRAEQLGWMVERQRDGLRIYHPSGGYLDVTADSLEAFNFQGAGCHQAAEPLIQAMGIEGTTSNKPEYQHVTAKQFVKEPEDDS